MIIWVRGRDKVRGRYWVRGMDWVRGRDWVRCRPRDRNWVRKWAINDYNSLQYLVRQFILTTEMAHNDF